MSRPQPVLPRSLTEAATAARLAELRADAEREQLVRQLRSTRSRPRWPASVAAALRESLAGVLPVGAERREPCPTC